MTVPGGGGGSPARPGISRPHFTGRAAVLAVVLCAIALSLAYPVREYLAQRRQIDQLEARHQQLDAKLAQLQREWVKLKSKAYIEQQARDRLHLCLPTQMCYVIIDPKTKSKASLAAHQAATPWYARLWSSVQTANAQGDKTLPPARVRHRRLHEPGRR